MKSSSACVMLAALSLASAATAGERVTADVQCQATDVKLVYDCTFMLTGKKSGQPLAGAEIVVKADMPTMAMAHNVRPVTATPGKMAGHYLATLELEMHGEWALTLDVSGPIRDRVIRKQRFGGAMAHGGRDRGKMKHGGDMKKMKPKE